MADHQKISSNCEHAHIITMLRYINKNIKSTHVVVSVLKHHGVNIKYFYEYCGIGTDSQQKNITKRIEARKIWDVVTPVGDIDLLTDLIQSSGNINKYYQHLDEEEKDKITTFNSQNLPIQPNEAQIIISQQNLLSYTKLGVLRPSKPTNSRIVVTLRSHNGKDLTFIKDKKIGSERRLPKFGAFVTCPQFDQHELDTGVCKEVVDNRKHYFIYQSDTVREISSDYYTEIIKSRMNTQKTYKLVQHVKAHITRFTIFVTSRQRMADTTYANFISHNINVFHYKNLSPDFNLNTYKGVLVIQLESLHLLTSRVSLARPELLILDESTSILKQLNSSTVTHRFHSTVRALESLTQHSERVIAMDADIDNRTFSFLEANRTGDIRVQWNLLTRKEVKAYKYFHRGHAIRTLLEDLNNGLKLFIVCAYKSNVDTLQAIIESHFPNKSVLTHTAENSLEDIQKVAISNVNVYWKEHDVVIISPTITNGIDFNEIHFDKVWAFVDPRGPCHRDIKQMIGRIRNIGMNEIHYTVENHKGSLPTNLNNIMLFARLKYQYGLGHSEKSICKNDREASSSTAFNSHEYILGESDYEIRTADDGTQLMVKTGKKTVHWLELVMAMNIQESNMSNNNIEKCFEDDLFGQDIDIHPVSLPRGDELVECTNLYDNFKGIKKEIKQIKYKHYENVKVIDKQTCDDYKKVLSSGHGATTTMKESVDKFDINKNFIEPITCGQEFDYIKRNLRTFFTREVERYLNYKECKYFETHSDICPFGKTLSAEIKAIKRFIEFYGPNDPNLQLCDLDEITDEPFRRNKVEGFEVLKEINIAFNCGVVQEIKSLVPFAKIIRGMYSSWLGANLSGSKDVKPKKGEYDGIRHNQYAITYHDAFNKWNHKSDFSEQISYIKNFASHSSSSPSSPSSPSQML